MGDWPSMPAMPTYASFTVSGRFPETGYLAFGGIWEEPASALSGHPSCRGWVQGERCVVPAGENLEIYCIQVIHGGDAHAVGLDILQTAARLMPLTQRRDVTLTVDDLRLLTPVFMPPATSFAFGVWGAPNQAFSLSAVLYASRYRTYDQHFLGSPT